MLTLDNILIVVFAISLLPITSYLIVKWATVGYYAGKEVFYRRKQSFMSDVVSNEKKKDD